MSEPETHESLGTELKKLFAAAFPAKRIVAIEPLSGGITNTNFKVSTDSGVFVARISGQDTHQLGINRNHENTCAKIAAELGIAPEVYHLDEHNCMSISAFVPSSPLTEDGAKSVETIQRIAAIIQKYHTGPHIFPGEFFVGRVVHSYLDLAKSRGVQFPKEMSEAVSQVDRIEDATLKYSKVVPCHNDLLPANFLDDGEKIWLIDWEYAAMGERFFDLANFAENINLSQDGENILLSTYFEEFSQEDLAHLRLYRFCSNMRESLWGFLQSSLSKIDFDYVGYGQEYLNKALAAQSTASFAESLKIMETP